VAARVRPIAVAAGSAFAARLTHTLPVATLRRRFAAVVGLIGLRVLADSIKAPARRRAYRTRLRL
jgi:uncharacterized membrane protein YfcA